MLSRVNRISTALNAGAIRLKQLLIVPSAESRSPPSLCVNAANSGPAISTVLRVAQRVVEADRHRQFTLRLWNERLTWRKCIGALPPSIKKIE